MFYFDEALNEQPRSICKLVDANDSGFVLKGFIDENDFSLDVSHSFETAGGSGILGAARGIYDNLRPFILRRGIKAGELVNAAGNLVENFSPEIADGIKSIGGFIEEQGANLFNNHIELADDYLYMFKGTGISVPNTFDVILLSNGENDIYDEWRKILEKFIGDYTPYLSDMIGVQQPPAGFESNLSALRQETGKNYKGKGTFVLFVGVEKEGGWRFPGMVVENMQHTISRVITESPVGKLRPLFIQIKFTLKCVKKLVKGDIIDNLT